MNFTGLAGAAALAAGDHGWMEYVSPRPLAEEADARRYLNRSGALLALLRILGGGDAHTDNLIAVYDRPVLIDCEMLVIPQDEYIISVVR